MTVRELGRPRVAYLLKRFPRLSETFILHEILELERQGLPLTLFSILNPGEEIVNALQGVMPNRDEPEQKAPAGPRVSVPLSPRPAAGLAT